MIRAKNLDLCRQKNQRLFKVFSGLDFYLAAGQGLMICGANGAGKSTLLSLLAGLLPPGGCGAPGEGMLAVGGLDAIRDNSLFRRKSALMLQDADMQILGGTAGEDLLIGLPQSGKSQAEARDMAARLGLAGQWNTPVQQLSYGQKRKLCLAGALLARPGLLLLDEPLSGLDYPSARELLAMLADLKAQGLTLAVASHDLNGFMDIADQVLLLREGEPAFFGPPPEALPKLEAAGVRRPFGY